MTENTNTETTFVADREDIIHNLAMGESLTDILVPVGENGPSAETVKWATDYAEAPTDERHTPSAVVDAVLAELVAFKQENIATVYDRIDFALFGWSYDLVGMDVTATTATFTVKDIDDINGELDDQLRTDITDELDEILYQHHADHLEVILKEAPTAN